MLNSNRAASRPRVHSTPETWRCVCDGCRDLDCIRVDRSRLHPWRYYCDFQHKTIDPWRVRTCGMRDKDDNTA